MGEGWGWKAAAVLVVLAAGIGGGVLGLHGAVEDLTCTADTISESNRDLSEVLQDLCADSVFFSIFKVDMYRECPFWPDDGMCTSKDCGVQCCGEEDVPAVWRAEGESGCLECRDDPKVKACTACGHRNFETHDEDVWINQEDESDMIYVDLRANPEGYTGFRGDSARRAWTAIYEENCFTFAKKCAGGICGADSCKEERVFYRLISGIHTSITMSIVRDFLYDDEGNMKMNMYMQRVGYHDDRKRNLYFLLALTSRAVAKAEPILSAFDYSTGNEENDALTRAGVDEVLGHPSLRPGCMKTFDESDMFQGDPLLKHEFRAHFRNISSIMDCVGCEKCKLWGKVQFLGIGTALKILFDDDTTLQRNEVIALFQLFRKTSHSLSLMEELDSIAAANAGQGSGEQAPPAPVEVSDANESVKEVEEAPDDSAEQAPEVEVSDPGESVKEVEEAPDEPTGKEVSEDEMQDQISVESSDSTRQSLVEELWSSQYGTIAAAAVTSLLTFIPALVLIRRVLSNDDGAKVQTRSVPATNGVPARKKAM